MSKENRPIVHFIGIGGIGMNALARWFLAKNWAISGSDIENNDILKDLRKARINVKIGHKRANLPADGRVSPRLVIYSNAIRSQNPELREAQKRGIPVYSYPRIVGELTKHYTTITVSGSHGKSTTTAIVARILAEAHLDPTVIVGTRLREFGNTGFRDGNNCYFVLEADEYRGAFLKYSPTLAVITNLDIEHLDYYKNIVDIKKTFLKFIRRIHRRGTLIVNRDNVHLRSIAPQINRIALENNLTVHWYSLRDPLVKKIKRVIRIPGTHNISNALAALTVADTLRIPRTLTLRAIHNYRGAWRRLERRGTIIHDSRQRRGSPKAARFRIPVYDDYAHHPTEIKATLQALREQYPKRKILCVFQPHHADRLTRLFEEFQTAFDNAGATLILPVYHVAGREIPKVGTYRTSHDLVRAIQKKHPKKLLFYLENLKNLKKAVTALLSPITYHLSPIVVMMGAGNITNYTNILLGKNYTASH